LSMTVFLRAIICLSHAPHVYLSPYENVVYHSPIEVVYYSPDRVVYHRTAPHNNVEVIALNRGGSAGRVDATRGSKHRGLDHAGEKRKSEAQACSLRGDCT
jgi:hypothetical protein